MIYQLNRLRTNVIRYIIDLKMLSRLTLFIYLIVWFDFRVIFITSQKSLLTPSNFTVSLV